MWQKAEKGRKMIRAIDIYKGAFDVIQESREWAYDVEPKEYANFVDGVVTLAQELLDKITITQQEQDKMPYGV